jgi:pyruvate/2-oxoglutarate/acetoin dehydrogenase E1 component
LREDALMAEKTYIQAMVDALAASMAQRPEVEVLGIVSFLFERGLSADAEQAFWTKYKDRCIEPPTAESLVALAAVGAACAGMRPFVNFGTSAFAFEAWGQIVNEAAVTRYISGGQFTVPVVYHSFHGLRSGSGAQHGHIPQAMYANCAGLEVVVPATPADAYGLMRSAIESDNPTVFLSHVKLLRTKGEVPDGDYTIPFGQVAIKRTGSDVTIVASSITVGLALEAAQTLAAEGIEAEVLDLRTIVPLDRDGICAAVARTGRLVVVDEGNETCGVAAEVAAPVATRAFDALKAPIARVTKPDVPAPYSLHLEAAIIPTAAKIVDAARALL